MSKHKNKLSLVLAFLAVVTFAAVSLGGNFLHTKIHHHQDQSSREECPVSQLQAQVLIALPAVLLAVFFRVAFRSTKTHQESVVQSLYSLPPLRAPPVSLL